MDSVRGAELKNWQTPVVVASMICAIALGVGGCSSQFRKLPESDVDPTTKSLAERIGTRILESWRDGGFEPLGDECTGTVRSGLTPESQEQAYESVKGMFGDFQSMEYVETWVPADGSLLSILRFRGHFSGSEARPEIRVVLDGEGKLAGLWIKPWRAKLE